MTHINLFISKLYTNTWQFDIEKGYHKNLTIPHCTINHRKKITQNFPDLIPSCSIQGFYRDLRCSLWCSRPPSRWRPCAWRACYRWTPPWAQTSPGPAPHGLPVPAMDRVLLFSIVPLINLFTKLRFVNQVVQSLVLIQEAFPASCADYNLELCIIVLHLQCIFYTFKLFWPMVSILG